MQRFFHLDLQRKDDRNAWFFVVEIFWAAILGAATSFNSAFAIRLGASNAVVGLLSSIPAMLAVLVSIPAGQFLETRSQRKPWLMWALAIYRSSYLMIALLPWLGIPSKYLGPLVVGVLVVMTIPAHFFNVGWYAMLADTIPEGRRAAVFSARNISANITNSASVFLFGIWLTWMAFPLNYQLMYIFGFVVSLLSWYNIAKIDVPDSPVKAAGESQRTTLKTQWLTFIKATRENPEFMKLTTNTLMHGAGLWIASPLYIIYYVRQLSATDSWLGLQGTLASLATIAGYAFWRWAMGRWGESKTLKRTIPLAGLFPIIVGLSNDLTVILIIIALNSLLGPGINLSHFNTLLKTTPEDSRPAFTAIYITIVNSGAFIGPMLGVAIANAIGIGPTLIACGIIATVGSSSFVWRPVKAFKEHEVPAN